MAALSRILIVDDDQELRAFLTLTFELAGYLVKTACSGREAIALCSAEPFDLMLSDVTMPGIDGHQLAQWVAAHHPSTRTALMSGLDAVCHNCSFSPRCRLIEKPFDFKEVLAFVDEALATS